MGDFLYIKTGDIHSKVLLSEILYAKAERKYVRIVTVNKFYFIRCSISCLQESTFNHLHFCRVHKSYIVSINHIASFGNSTIFIEGQKIPVGRHYKKHLLETLHSLGTDIKRKSAQFDGNVDSLLESIEP